MLYVREQAKEGSSVKAEFECCRVHCVRGHVYFQNSNVASFSNGSSLVPWLHGYQPSDDSVMPHLLSRVLLLLLRLRRGLRLGPRHLGQDGGHLLPLVKRLPEVIESQYVLADLLQKTIRKDLVNES